MDQSYDNEADKHNVLLDPNIFDDDIENYNRDGILYSSKCSEIFFRDGIRRIDYVLVYNKDKDNEYKQTKRFAFLNALAAQLIEIEVEDCHGNLIGETGPLGRRVSQMEDQLETAKSTEELNYLDDLETGLESENSLEADILSITNLVFVKLHATWSALTLVAELMQFRKPLKKASSERLSMEKHSKKSNCFQLDPKIVHPIPLTYTWPFLKSQMHLFDIPKDRSIFFTPVERSLVINYLIRRSGFTEAKRAQDLNLQMTDEAAVNVEAKSGIKSTDIQLIMSGDFDLGISKLLTEKVFDSAYSLHEPSEELINLLILRERDRLSEEPLSSRSSPPLRPVQEFNTRMLLSTQWASMKKVFKNQPLDYVKLYFGESIALYFAWMGVYTTWLIPVGIFGLVVFLIAAYDINDFEPLKDICLHGDKYIMCPPCSASSCKYWKLSSSCFASKLTHLIDNGGTVLFAIFMSLWATLFLENWKRTQIRLAYRWNVQNLEPIDEPPRPEFLALLDKSKFKKEINPATGRYEPLIPFWSRQVPIFFITYSTVFFGVLLCVAFLVGVIIYRLIIKILLLHNNNSIIVSSAGIITTMTSSCINLICIFILKVLYDRVAVKMTNLENHRTQLEYDNSLTLKLYLLQFVNFYSSVFYIAFLQGNTKTIPGDTSSKIPSSGCDGGNCLFELFIQLAVIMVGKQFINFIQENTIPPLKRLVGIVLAKRSMRKKVDFQAAQEKSKNYGSLTEEMGAYPKKARKLTTAMLLCRNDYTLLDAGSQPLFEEYLEMMIQYGFITMFVPAFPLAPLFALLNNIFELRADATKFLKELRRPLAVREKTIGIWFSILSVLSSIAVRTNACLIAFTSDFIDRLVYMFAVSDTISLVGYVNFTLSTINIAGRFSMIKPVPNDITICRYRDYRGSESPYKFTAIFWQILAIKFVFVFIFENVAICLTSLIAELIPDIPSRLSVLIQHEKRVANELIMNSELEKELGIGDRSEKPDKITQPTRLTYYSYDRPSLNKTKNTVFNIALGDKSLMEE